MRAGPLRAAGIALAASVALGCDQPKGDLPPPPPTSGGRSNAVTATATSQTAPVKPTATASAAPSAPRQLCTTREQRPAPKSAIQTAAAPGAAPPPAPIPFGAGKWIWINLWAAWCAPCKEEMPRLIAWREQLRQKGVLLDLAFVSLDDDERQLGRFLETQPPNGVRSTYWLPDGPLRAPWLASLGLKDTPELPVQALVAPSGQIACQIQGAVEDRDYPGLASFVGAK